MIRYEYATGKHGVKIMSIPIGVCDNCKMNDANMRIEFVSGGLSSPITDLYYCDDCNKTQDVRCFVDSIISSNLNTEFEFIEKE